MYMARMQFLRHFMPERRSAGTNGFSTTRLAGNIMSGNVSSATTMYSTWARGRMSKVPFYIYPT